MRGLGAIAVCACVALAAPHAHAADNLRIIVVDGDEAANIVAERIAAEPVIEVRDKDNRRVPGAVVRFAIRKARNRLIAAFRNGQSEVRTLTDASGRASANAVTPLEPGRFQIDVEVSFRGQTGKATINHTNFATTADAKAAGRESPKSTNQNVASHTSGTTSTAGAAAAPATAAAPAAGVAAAAGGGVSKVAVIGLVAGGAAGAGAAVVLSKKEDAPAGQLGAPTVSQSSGLQSATSFAFAVQPTGFDAASLAYRWEFGDGATSTDPAPTHVYATPGTFVVVVTVSDARQSQRSESRVTVHTLTSTWTADNGSVLRLTQATNTVTGSEYVNVDWPDCPVSGTTQSGSPAIVVTRPPCPGVTSPIRPLLVPVEYRFDVSADGQSLTGTRRTLAGGGAPVPIVYRR